MPLASGPEIIVKALAYKSVYSMCQPVVIGSPDIFQEAIAKFTPPGVPGAENSMS